VVNQALIGLFGRFGRGLSLAVLLFTVPSAVLSSVPKFFGDVAAVLPTHPAVLVLRAVAADTGQGVRGGVIGLVLWLVAGAAALLAVTEFRRTLSGKQLRATRLATVTS
jgi:putative membrane protein